jgi:hypothetical protein
MKKYYKRWLKVLGVWDRVEELGGGNSFSLSTAFPWQMSSEGHEYWKSIYDRILVMEKLVLRVSEIDPEAAKYLKKDMWKRGEMERVNATFPYAGDGDNIYTMFNWRKTPQGTEYWADIARKLGGNHV